MHLEVSRIKKLLLHNIFEELDYQPIVETQKKLVEELSEIAKQYEEKYSYFVVRKNKKKPYDENRIASYLSKFLNGKERPKFGVLELFKLFLEKRFSAKNSTMHLEVYRQLMNILFDPYLERSNSKNQIKNFLETQKKARFTTVVTTLPLELNPIFKGTDSVFSLYSSMFNEVLDAYASGNVENESLISRLRFFLPTRKLAREFYLELQILIINHINDRLLTRKLDEKIDDSKFEVIVESMIKECNKLCRDRTLKERYSLKDDDNNLFFDELSIDRDVLGIWYNNYIGDKNIRQLNEVSLEEHSEVIRFASEIFLLILGLKGYIKVIVPRFIVPLGHYFYSNDEELSKITKITEIIYAKVSRGMEKQYSQMEVNRMEYKKKIAIKDNEIETVFTIDHTENDKRSAKLFDLMNKLNEVEAPNELLCTSVLPPPLVPDFRRFEESASKAYDEARINYVKSREAVVNRQVDKVKSYIKSAIDRDGSFKDIIIQDGFIIKYFQTMMEYNDKDASEIISSIK